MLLFCWTFAGVSDKTIIIIIITTLNWYTIMVLRNISSIEGKQHYSVHDQDYTLLVHLVIQWNLSMQEFQGYPITVVHIESSASSQTLQS